MFEKLKSIIGLDIKNEKYALVKDEKFGLINASKKVDTWIRSTCGYC